MSDDEYAGDLSPKETWELMQDDKRAVLVDVRTDAEFAYVGGPDPKAFKLSLIHI